ncbi:MAG: hypothetical protein WCJ56_09740, partial [bacterium]
HSKVASAISYFYEGYDLKAQIKAADERRTAHKRLLNAAINAGIEVISVDNHTPLNQALQSIGRFT